jgi:hypothetical protein
MSLFSDCQKEFNILCKESIDGGSDIGDCYSELFRLFSSNPHFTISLYSGSTLSRLRSVSLGVRGEGWGWARGMSQVTQVTLSVRYFR